jgi:hypothetical protein
MKTENLRNQQSLITLQQKELGWLRETVKTEMERHRKLKEEL